MRTNHSRNLIVLTGATFVASAGMACDVGPNEENGAQVIILNRPGASSIVEVQSGRGGATDETVQIEFQVRDFDLEKPGDCHGRGNCGHIHIFVGDGDCGDEIATCHDPVVSVPPAGLGCKGSSLPACGVPSRASRSASPERHRHP